MSGKIENLPKWAQDRIRNLERDLGDARDEARAQYSTEPSTVAIKDYANGGRPLPRRTAIEFSLESGVVTDEANTTLLVRHVEDGEGIELHLSGRGAFHILQVTAQSTNVFVVRATDRR